MIAGLALHQSPAVGVAAVPPPIGEAAPQFAALLASRTSPGPAIATPMDTVEPPPADPVAPPPIARAEALLAQLAAPVRSTAARASAGTDPTHEDDAADAATPEDADAAMPAEDCTMVCAAMPADVAPAPIVPAAVAAAGPLPAAPGAPPPAAPGMPRSIVAGATRTTPAARFRAEPDAPASPQLASDGPATNEADIAEKPALPFVLAAGGGARQPASPVAVGGAAPAVPAEFGIAHHLDLGQDQAWLNQLAQDIARSADTNGHLRFALAPQHLGRMTVELAAGADGTAVRMMTDTEQAQRILSDAQPRLVAEAQAQGLRITDLQIALDQRPHGGHRHDPDPAAATGDNTAGGGQADAGGRGGGGGQGGGNRARRILTGADPRQAPGSQAAKPLPAGRPLYA